MIKYARCSVCTKFSRNKSLLPNKLNVKVLGMLKKKKKKYQFLKIPIYFFFKKKKKSCPILNYTLIPKFTQYVALGDEVTSDPHPLFTPLYYINFL